MMWSYTGLFLTVLGCSVASLLWLWWNLATNRAHSAPSPRALPIIGHLHLLGNLPHQSLQKLAAKHGPLMQLQLGSVPTIVASSSDMAREILKTQDHIFCSRPRTTAGVVTMYNCSDMGWAPYGPYWRRMRQLCVTDLLGVHRVKAFKAVREQETAALVRSVASSASQTKSQLVDLRSNLGNMSNNIICRMAFGTHFKDVPIPDPSLNLPGLVADMLRVNGVFFLGDYLPFLTTLDPQGHLSEMKTIVKKSDVVLQNVIDTRRAQAAQSRPEDASCTDFLDALLAAGAAGSDISDDQIKAVLWDMFAGGTDTSAVTAEWSLAELLRNPIYLQRLQEEIDSAVGTNRLLDETDIPHLPFLQAVVKETFRLHPAVPLLIPHESLEACEVGGFHVAAKTRALVNVWAIGREASVWEQPLEFWPDRFLGDNSPDVRGQHFGLLPFGAGRRGCPGMNLGLLTVQTMVGALVHAFDWSASPRHDIDMQERFGMVVAKSTPLVATASRRLSSNVYA